MIILAKKDKKDKKSLAIENIDKTAKAKVAKVSNAIHLDSKYSWAISNSDMDAAKDLKLTEIKKYLKCAGQIQDKMDWLYKN